MLLLKNDDTDKNDRSKFEINFTLKLMISDSTAIIENVSNHNLQTFSEKS